VKKTRSSSTTRWIPARVATRTLDTATSGETSRNRNPRLRKCSDRSLFYIRFNSFIRRSEDANERDLDSTFRAGKKTTSNSRCMYLQSATCRRTWIIMPLEVARFVDLILLTFFNFNQTPFNSILLFLAVDSEPSTRANYKFVRHV